MIDEPDRPKPQEIRRDEHSHGHKHDVDRQDSVLAEGVLEKFMEQDSQGVAKFLMSHGIRSETAQMFAKHNIDGSICPYIEEKHLQEMGISTIGERLHVIQLLGRCKTGARWLDRNKLLYEHLEFRPLTNAPCCPFVPYGCPCCCFLAPLRNIKLTNNNLQVTGVKKEGCCDYTYYALCRCIASPELIVDNIDLSRITDINRVRKGRECCEVSQTWITITTEDQAENAEQNEKKILKFNNTDGPKFERLLRNAMEENQNFRGFKRPY